MSDIGQKLHLSAGISITYHVTSHGKRCEKRGRRQKVRNAREKTTPTMPTTDCWRCVLARRLKQAEQALRHHRHRLSALKPFLALRRPLKIHALVATSRNYADCLSNNVDLWLSVGERVAVEIHYFSRKKVSSTKWMRNSPELSESEYFYRNI